MPPRCSWSWRRSGSSSRCSPSGSTTSSSRFRVSACCSSAPMPSACSPPTGTSNPKLMRVQVRPSFRAFSSFPNFIWERLLFLAKFHFALTCSRRRKAVDHALTGAATRSAIELPQQVRSQVQLGNEGKLLALWLRRGIRRLIRRHPITRPSVRRALPVFPVRPPGFHVHFLLHRLQQGLLPGCENRRNLGVRLLHDLRDAPHFVPVHRLKLVSGLGQDRVNLRLLIGGQVQPFGQGPHPMVPHVARAGRVQKKGAEDEGQRAARHHSQHEDESPNQPPFFFLIHGVLSTCTVETASCR